MRALQKRDNALAAAEKLEMAATIQRERANLVKQDALQMSDEAQQALATAKAIRDAAEEEYRRAENIVREMEEEAAEKRELAIQYLQSEKEYRDMADDNAAIAAAHRDYAKKLTNEIAREQQQIDEQIAIDEQYAHQLAEKDARENLDRQLAEQYAHQLAEKDARENLDRQLAEQFAHVEVSSTSSAVEVDNLAESLLLSLIVDE